MDIQLDTNSKVPVYEQIVDQVMCLVAAGVLVPGQALPPLHKLAKELGVNPNTVVRAYRELEVAGVVVKRGTTGTFVSDTLSFQDLRQRLLIEPMKPLLQRTKLLGVGIEELCALLGKLEAETHEGSQKD